MCIVSFDLPFKTFNHTMMEDMKLFKYKDSSNIDSYSHTHPSQPERSKMNELVEEYLIHREKQKMKKSIEEYLKEKQNDLIDDLMELVDQFSTGNVNLKFYQRVRKEYQESLKTR